MWVAASAKAAIQVLSGQVFNADQELILPSQNDHLRVSVSSCATIASGESAIAINYVNSGLPLDITNGMELWVIVSLKDNSALNNNGFPLKIIAGEGVGKIASNNEPLLSVFAKELLLINLSAHIPEGSYLHLEIIFPNGKELSKRTSNRAFGIVDGLGVIGTQAESQISASPELLQELIDNLRSAAKAGHFDSGVVFVIGSNGYDLACNYGINSRYLVKTGNWLGPLLVAASEERIPKLLIFGYHGKLVKLAGGIFHTHNHLADGRLEILIALAVKAKLPSNLIQLILDSSTIQDALLSLQSVDTGLTNQLWKDMAVAIEKRSASYVSRYSECPISIGSAIFDGQRRLRWTGPIGRQQLKSYGVNLDD